MADSFIIIDEPAVTDKKLDTEQLTVGVNTVERERVRVAGAAATDLAPVSSTNGLAVDVKAIAAGTNNIGDVDVLSVPAPLNVTGTGLEATALRVTLASDSTGVLSVDDNGASLTVDVGTALPAGANNIGDVDVLSVVPGTGATNLGKAEDDAHTTGDVGVMALGVRTDSPINRSGLAGDYEPFQISSGRLWVSAVIDTGLPAGVSNIGDVDVLTIAAGDNNIGNVDIVTVPAPLSTTGGGVEATALRVTVASDSTGVLSIDDNAGSLTVDQATAASLKCEPAGNVAHDAADSGNPIKIGGRADTTFQTAAADADRVDALFDVYGQIRTRTDHANLWSYHENSSSALTDTSVQAAPGVGLSLYVTDIVVSTGAATAMNIFFEEGASTVLGPYYLEAVAGRGLVISFKTPKKITANTALTVTTSAAIAHSIDVTGFIAP